MPWWKKPFTIIFVPHDGSNTRSIKIQSLTILTSFIALLTLLGFASLFAYKSFSESSLVSKNKNLKKKITKLQEQNRRYQKLGSNIKTIKQKLDKSRKLHNSILKMSGLQELASSDARSKAVNIAELSNTGDQLEKTQEILRNQDKKNENLKDIKRLVENRNRVFQHTPILWPVDGWLSSSYGYRKDPMGGKGRSFHEGVDLAAWFESPVRVPADGKVIFSGREGGYGETIKIRHEYGYTTVYGHLSERLVQEGESVARGSLIGRVGSTGHSTGSHLHYEVRVNGEAVNPWPYLVQEYESYKSAIDQEATPHAGN